MFFTNQTNSHKDNYEKYLKTVGSLSNLFSDSATPYLYYRLAEKVFCRAFEADDLSRSDVAIDAKKGLLGIGLKTFLLGNNKTFQKVAEFNADRHLYDTLSPLEKVKKIAQLRNDRIGFAERTYGLNSSIYHCVVRDKGAFLLFEEVMDYVAISKIKLVKESKASIHFEDGMNHYSFSLSKSTLLKRFNTTKPSYTFEVNIFEDPLLEIQKLVKKANFALRKTKYLETIYLPLYGKDKTVYENSGLNQWNAKGRKRAVNEAYIPVPSFIHKAFPNFFPNKETKFSLKLPDGKILNAKICQSGGKVLMSAPNKDLGEWILRTILQLPENTLLTYTKLEELGIDSVRIDKVTNELFEINFSSVGTFERWSEKVKTR